MRLIEEQTGPDCIKFVERTKQFHYINIFSGSGCYSYIGMNIWKGQSLSLNKEGCLGQGSIIHELVHALGF